MAKETLHSISVKTDKTIKMIGYVLRKIRSENGYTVEEVSDMVGVGQRTVRNAELSRNNTHIQWDKMAEPRISTVMKMCIVYKVDLSDLLKRVEETIKNQEQDGI